MRFLELSDLCSGLHGIEGQKRAFCILVRYPDEEIVSGGAEGAGLEACLWDLCGRLSGCEDFLPRRTLELIEKKLAAVAGFEGIDGLRYRDVVWPVKDHTDLWRDAFAAGALTN